MSTMNLADHVVHVGYTFQLIAFQKFNIAKRKTMNVLHYGFFAAVVIHVERVEAKRATLLTESSSLPQTCSVYVLTWPLYKMSYVVAMVHVRDYSGAWVHGVDSLLCALLELVPVLSVTREWIDGVLVVGCFQCTPASLSMTVQTRFVRLALDRYTSLMSFFHGMELLSVVV